MVSFLHDSLIGCVEGGSICVLVFIRIIRVSGSMKAMVKTGPILSSGKMDGIHFHIALGISAIIIMPIREINSESISEGTSLKAIQGTPRECPFFVTTP